MSQNGSDISIPIAESQGGTGKTSFTKGQLLTGNASGGLSALSPPADGQYLVADSTQSSGYKGSTFVQPGYHSVANPKWQNTRQVSVANYAVTDDTNTISMSGSSPTTLDVGQVNGAGGQMVSANLAGTVQVNRNQISGTGTTFTTTFQVGDIINLPSFYQSRKITQIYNNTEMLTDAGDTFVFRDWQCVGTAAISTAQAKFGSSSLYCPGTTGNYAQVASYESQTQSVHAPENTIEFFCYPTSFANIATPFCSANGDYRICLNQQTNGTLQYYLSSNGTSWDLASATAGSRALTLNAWNHITIVSYLGAVNIYVNGVLDLTVYSITGLFVDAHINHRLGQNSNASYPQAFVGYFDAYRVSACARYTGNFTPPVTAFTPDYYTLALCHFEGVNGSINLNTSELARQSPVRWDNTIANATTIQSTVAKFGSTSLYLAGNGYGVCLNTGLTQGSMPANHCLEFWIYPTVIPASGSYYVLLNSYNTGYIYNVNQAGSKLQFSIGNNGTSANIATATGTTTITANTWVHYALTFDGTTYRQFVNGALDASATSAGTPVNYWAKAIAFGASLTSNTSIYTGYIDELRFSNVARYTAAFTAPTSAFTVDANTISLNHFESPAASNLIQDGEQIGGTSYARGGLARSTFYYPYVVGSSSSSQLMFSPRCKSYGETLIDLPSGMTYVKQLKFAVLVNYRGNIPRFVLSGNMLNYTFVEDPANATFGFSGDYMLLSGGKATTFSTIATSTLIPKISTLGFIASYLYNDSATQITSKVRTTADNFFPNGQTVGIVSSTTNSAYNMGNYNDTFIGLNSQQQFDYKMSSAGSNANCGFLVKGYRITEV